MSRVAVMATYDVLGECKAAIRRCSRICGNKFEDNAFSAFRLELLRCSLLPQRQLVGKVQLTDLE